MASGIKCHPSCLSSFHCIKMEKKYRFVLYSIYNNEEIRVVHEADRDTTHEDFRKHLEDAMKRKEGLYAVYDYECPVKGPTLFFIAWTPNTLNVKTKMIYAASKDSIKSQLRGVKHNMEAHELDDISEEEFRKRTT